MCDPVSIGIALASKLASTYFENKAAGAVANRRSSVAAQTDQDLKKYRNTAAEQFQKSLTGSSSDTINQNITADTAERAHDYQDVIPQEDLLPTQKGASSAAQKAIVDALQSGVSRSKELAGKRAALDAYGDTTQRRDILTGRAGQKIDQQGDFARGRERVGELELADANSAGGKYAKLAGIVDALGTVGGAAYGAGAGQGLWGGYDPASDITWNTGRQQATMDLFGRPVGTFRKA